MADSQKYYYMRLKDNFFENETIAVLESMQDGYLYCNILLKLYLRSLKDNGRLMFCGAIPYNAQMIATLTRHQVGTVERALDIFVQLELIEILDTGAIYMLDIQNYIGQATTDADRKREYRTRIESEKARNIAVSDKCPDKTPPEIRDKILENRRIKNTAPTGADGEYTNSGELLPVLPLFFDAYEKHTGHKHPKVSESKLQEITARLKEYGADGDYPEDWVAAYFGTDGRKGLCGASDCSVFHFSSEGVLTLVLARVVGSVY